MNKRHLKQEIANYKNRCGIVINKGWSAIRDRLNFCPFLFFTLFIVYYFAFKLNICE